MSQCAQQMIWMHSWLSKVEVDYSILGLIRGDNCGAIALTKNTKDHGKVSTLIFDTITSRNWWSPVLYLLNNYPPLTILLIYSQSLFHMTITTVFWLLSILLEASFTHGGVLKLTRAGLLYLYFSNLPIHQLTDVHQLLYLYPMSPFLFHFLFPYLFISCIYILHLHTMDSQSFLCTWLRVSIYISTFIPFTYLYYYRTTYLQ